MNRQRMFRSLAAAGAVVFAVGSADNMARAADDTILIGGSLCLTGIQAPLDEPGLRGVELAVKAINDKGGVLGKQLRFINLDGQSDPVTVGTNAQQLIAEGIEYMISPCDFDMGSPANRAAQEAGIVGISTCASSPLAGSVTQGDKQFTLAMWNTTMGSAAAEYAHDTKGWETAYVVTDTFIDYTTSLSEFFIEHFESLGGTVIAEDKYTQGAQDFSAQLARLKRLDEQPDVIFISSYMPDLGTIIRDIRQAGIDSPIMGGDSYDDSGLFDVLGEKYGNDIYFVAHSFMEPGVTPDMAEFLELYQEEYGEEPDTAMVATGWDVVQVFADAAERAGTTDGEALAKAMENHEFDLLTGKLTWSDAATGHEPDKDAPMVELKDGVPTFVGWIRPTNLPKPAYLVKYLERQGE
ncbi:MAG TPA: ABC transporter substrate-binding protein [Paracoccaceae bacterium]|nr:ABC transporter substrate-binding protein [Paracoccaceae bacterium]